jgi:hypothetical protein
MKRICQERSDNGWTLDTLAKHLNEKIDDVEIRTQERFALAKQAIDAALMASEKAISAAMAAAEKAEVAAEKRFDSVNEFRAAMKDQTANFADRDQVDFRLGSIEKKIESWQGHSAGISNFWGVLTVGLGVIFAGIMAATVLMR